MPVKNKYICTAFLWCVLLTQVSCKKTEISEPKDYFGYLANPGNGLVKEKTVAGLSLKAKYIPKDYLVYNAVKGFGTVNNTFKDSIEKTYSHSLTFMITIGPGENETFDITRVGVDSYEAFAKRMEEMSFNAQEWISLVVKEKDYKPEIVRMENINALEKSRNFIVVFSSAEGSETDLRKSDMCLSYDDELFNTGTSKFMFYSKDIQAVPKFIF